MRTLESMHDGGSRPEPAAAPGRSRSGSARAAEGAAPRPRRSGPATAAWVVGLLAAFVVLGGLRPDDPDSTGLFRFEPGYDVEHYDSDGGRVRVHFTRTGPDAVRPDDADADGVPDAVVLVAETYEEVLTHYADLGFRTPVSDLGTSTGDGGSDRLDVYLVDFGGAADGAFVAERCEAARAICSGYVAQENDYAGYGYPSFAVATRTLASHELFHAVQAAYDNAQGANWSEATAVWASEHFDPALPDLDHMVRGWLDKPDRSIDQDPIGPVDSYSYGLAIFAQFLAERFDVDLHRLLWEDLEDGARGVADPHWPTALAALLERAYASTFPEAWVELATWVLRCGHGGDAGETFANAALYPRAARQDVVLPHREDRLRVFRASMQLWSASPVGRPTVAAALASPDPSALEDLGLVLAVRRGPFITAVVADGPAGEIDASGGAEVIVLVANTALAGQSRRPGLCVGAPAEVAACVAALTASVAEPADEGADVVEAAPDDALGDDVLGDDAVPGEDVAPAADTSPTPRDAGGCAGGGAPLGPFGAALLGLALVLTRRRRLGERSLPSAAAADARTALGGGR